MRATLAWTACGLFVALSGTATPALAQHEPGWLQQHGTDVRKDASACVACHTRNSCLECHIGTPEVAKDIPPATPDNPGLAQVTVTPPETHKGDWRHQHGRLAAAQPEYCANCHVRSDCLSCHRADAGSGSPGYHQAGFLARHPAEAYARATSCSECHNVTQFCASCHKAAGLVANGRTLQGGYHDGNQSFLVGHGQAARQSLESCTACHAQRDCMQCHAVRGQGIQGINPHGTGSNASLAAMKQRDPAMCVTCHGAAVPDVP
jgi:hypothetical protein